MAPTRSAVDTLGFAVPKDIHNNPVREFDGVRYREMWWTALFVAVLVAGLLLAVWQQYQWRDVGYETVKLQKQKASAESANRQLTLEAEALRAPQRIEALATTELHLVMPTQTEAVVIQRVRQPAQPQPPRTLVALR
jgi:cell division protein FtsL